MRVILFLLYRDGTFLLGNVSVACLGWGSNAAEPDNPSLRSKWTRKDAITEIRCKQPLECTGMVHPKVVRRTRLLQPPMRVVLL